MNTLEILNKINETLNKVSETLDNFNKRLDAHKERLSDPKFQAAAQAKPIHKAMEKHARWKKRHEAKLNANPRLRKYYEEALDKINKHFEEIEKQKHSNKEN